jgi:hypothetical protein
VHVSGRKRTLGVMNGQRKKKNPDLGFRSRRCARNVPSKETGDAKHGWTHGAKHRFLSGLDWEAPRRVPCAFVALRPQRQQQQQLLF